MAKDKGIDTRGRESAVNSAVGDLLSWVAGKDSVKHGSSPRGRALALARRIRRYPAARPPG